MIKKREQKHDNYHEKTESKNARLATEFLKYFNIEYFNIDHNI